MSPKKLVLILIFVGCGILAAPYNHTYANAVASLLNKYTRPITVLSITPNSEDLIFNLASNYAGVFVIANQKNSAQLLTTCCDNNLQSVILLGEHLTPELITTLGTCEHFDVVLAYGAAEYYKEDWTHVRAAAHKLGDHLCIDGPDNQPCIINCPKKNLPSGRFNLSAPREKRTYKVYSSFAAKSFAKKDRKGHTLAKTDWHAGINLLTFHTLNGIFPTKQMLHALIAPLKDCKHHDLRIYNIILQGNQIKLIDFNNYTGQQTDNTLFTNQILSSLGIKI